MHIKDSLINFLYDKKYYITFYDNYLYCFNFVELLTLKDNLIVLKMPFFNINVEGDTLKVIKLCKNEILINGLIKNIGIIYE